MLQSSFLKNIVYQEGFSACGIARAEHVSAQRTAELKRWLANGEQGEMDYLARNVEKKLDPRLLFEGARTIISVAANYYPWNGRNDDNSRNHRRNEPTEDGSICLAKYAYGTDYHEEIKRRLRNVVQKAGFEENKDCRVFVDTAPIDEKYWAEQSGIGWRGRNSQLIIPGMGSYFFLGEIVLVYEVDKYDEKAKNRCGNCRACLDACPTCALHGDGTLDARRCLSYLTIEHRGDLPQEAKNKMYPCFYGCDRCADACPWNVRFARKTSIEAFQPRSSLMSMHAADWQHLTVEKYRDLFKKSAVKRAKYEGLMRNIRALFGH